MWKGGSLLREPVVAFETWGRLNERRDNAVLLFTGISAPAHAASSTRDPRSGWWEHMIGRGRPIDTSKFFLICVNSLGSCYGSTGPTSVDPLTGTVYGLRFPSLSIEDIAESTVHLLDHLGITTLHSLVGPSMGGMAALALQAMHRGISRHMLLISCAFQSNPAAIALRRVQRNIIRLDPSWNFGRYSARRGPAAGMKIARMLGMISYRSSEEWDARFGRALSDDLSVEDAAVPFETERFEVNAYLDDRGRAFAETFDPNSYLCLSAACDSFDFGAHLTAFRERGAGLLCDRLMVIGVRTDGLFPITQQREIASRMDGVCGRVELVELPSIQGHDAFLADMARFGPAVARFFDDV